MPTLPGAQVPASVTPVKNSGDFYSNAEIVCLLDKLEQQGYDLSNPVLNDLTIHGLDVLVNVGAN